MSPAPDNDADSEIGSSLPRPPNSCPHRRPSLNLSRSQKRNAQKRVATRLLEGSSASTNDTEMGEVTEVGGRENNAMAYASDNPSYR